MNDVMKPEKLPSLSIVIPFYNEEPNAEESIRGALEYLKKRTDDFEIVAVDDHSTDATLQILLRMHAAEPRIRIFSLPENTRFAGALKRGFAASEKDYVFYTDGDCPIDYGDIDKAIEHLDRFDVVIGYRIDRDREGPLRKLYTLGYRAALFLLFGMRYRDVNFSFKLFPRKALQSIVIESSGSFIDAEILYKLKKAGLRIGEIPVKYFSRRKGVSTLASPMIILKIIWEMASFRISYYGARRLLIPKDTGIERPDPAHRQRR